MTTTWHNVVRWIETGALENLSNPGLDLVLARKMAVEHLETLTWVQNNLAEKTPDQLEILAGIGITAEGLVHSINQFGLALAEIDRIIGA